MGSWESPALAWVALAILAAIIEVSIPHFGVVFVSVGAVAAAIVAAIGFGFPAQVIVFVFALGLSLGLLRPRLIRQLGGRGVPSRTDTLIGRQGVVTQEIEARVGSGRVNVGGEDWAARAAVPLPVGTKIRVVAADGIVLEVTSA
jgi:membrane protein implicated in regulation of membrane protease activity